MRRKASEKVAAPVLDDLLGDGRLARLFSKEPRDCALQLWVLQIKNEELMENRVAYGRLLPYNHSTDSWSASNDDAFGPFGNVQAQVIRLNLYCKSVHCAELLRLLSTGRTIAEITDELKLSLSDPLRARFGTTALVAEDLVYRPVAYLLNRDAYDRSTPSSPHGGAGAFSASITRTSKGELFRLGPDYDVALTATMIKQLNADTGLVFSDADTARFGDIELLVFPTLDDEERQLLEVTSGETPRSLIARFNPMQMPHFGGFQFRLSIANDAQIVYSGIATAERDADGIYECRFELSDHLYEVTDSTELEIFGFHNEYSCEATLCSRWRTGYVRDISIQGFLVGGGASAVKFDWLEKAANRPALAGRVKAALTINRGNRGFDSSVGGRVADPWVPANRNLVSLFSKLHPPKSEGRFFLRWGHGNGEGRLQFVEWFRALLTKYCGHQLVIFDPYFEDVGLRLVLVCADDGADVIVFTSLPKSKDEPTTERDADQPASGRVNNLVANCEHNRHLMRRMKLRVYGLKQGRLHDRYLLVMGLDNLPAAGFSLSNSFQKAAENYPLLVTPIPPDVLLQVERYKSCLVAEAQATRSDGAAENAAMRTLFESSQTSAQGVCFEPHRFLQKPLAGDVLVAWTGDSSLQGLSGDELKEQMKALGFLDGESLTLPESEGMGTFLRRHGRNFSDFTGTWEVLGELLAHISSMEMAPLFGEVASENALLVFLAQFLDGAFERVYDGTDTEVAVTPPRLFHEPVENFLRSAYHPHHLFHPTKYTALTWPEYYAIKLLWWHAPDTLLNIAEGKVVAVRAEVQGPDTMRLSLLSQIVSEISMSVQLNISAEQRGRLIGSSVGLLQWMGLVAIEGLLEKPDGLQAGLQLVGAFPYPEQVRALGWMVHRAASIPKKAELFRSLVDVLHRTLPEAVPAEDLRHLVDSMRGHMRELAWAEPWLFVDVIYPLLKDNRAKYEDACEIWSKELQGMLDSQHKDYPLLFTNEREGQTTMVAAYLVVSSTTERRQARLATIRAILNRQRRIVQQPLASTSNWTQWDNALAVSFWLLGFCRWVTFYLRQVGVTDAEWEQLTRDARDLAMVRPMVEWHREGAIREGQLVAFVDQIEGLLAAPC